MRINKQSDILYAFDDIKVELEKAQSSIAVMPALIHRFMYLFLQQVSKYTTSQVYLNHIHTDLTHKWEGVGKPMIITIYFHFDYVPTRTREPLESALKKLVSDFKFRDIEIKFIKEEGIYIRFSKEIK